MARSESQGYQIAVVILGILWVLTSVAAVVFAKQYSEAAKKSAIDASNAAEASTKASVAQQESAQIKQTMGFEQGMSIDAVKTAAEKDFALYAATLPESQRTYRAALEATAAALKEAQASLQIAQAESQSLKDINEAREKTKDVQVKEFSQQMEQARTDLTAEQAKYNTERVRLEKSKDELALQMQKTTSELNTSREQYDKDMSAAVAKDKLRTDEIKARNREIKELAGEMPAVADGSIREIDARLGVVYINLGEADHLPRQINFSVYGRDNNGVAKNKRKAAVEVTRLLAPHYAECRIIEHDLKDPIVQGDEIYTPLWEPGRPERFALAGLLDLDGDGESDREMIKELISMNGGIVDAELDDAGKDIGQMSTDTRFLILGKETENTMEKIGQMKAAAEELGVEAQPLAKFLDHVGWKSTNRTLRYGSDRYRDFYPEPSEAGYKASTGHTSQRFQRRPGELKKLGSAFDKKKSGERTDTTLKRSRSEPSEDEPAAEPDAESAAEPAADAPAEEKAPE